MVEVYFCFCNLNLKFKAIILFTYYYLPLTGRKLAEKLKINTPSENMIAHNFIETLFK